MLPSPGPKFYLVGAVLAAIGAFLMSMRGRRGEKPVSRARVSMVVGVVALGVGIAVVGVGIAIDLQYYAAFNTTVMSYDVSLEMNGTWPVRILLPAPSDSRLFDALDVTNGTAHLLLNLTAAEASVELQAQGNVTFRVGATLPTASVDRTFTRLASCTAPGDGLYSCAAIELSGVPDGAKVFLRLSAGIGVPCESHGLDLETWVAPGIASYAAETPMVVC